MNSCEARREATLGCDEIRSFSEIPLVYCPDTPDDVLKEDPLDPLMIDDRECPDEVNHCFFGELICTELDIDIPILLFIVMISEYTIHHSPDILFIIVDSDFYLISSCEDRVHDKILRELLFQIGIEYIDHSLQLYPIVSVESDGGSRSLPLGFFPFESVFDHIVLSDW